MSQPRSGCSPTSSGNGLRYCCRPTSADGGIPSVTTAGWLKTSSIATAPASCGGTCRGRIFGPWQTVWKRHRRYAGDGTWDRILTHIPSEADADLHGVIRRGLRRRRIRAVIPEISYHIAARKRRGSKGGRSPVFDARHTRGATSWSNPLPWPSSGGGDHPARQTRRRLLDRSHPLRDPHLATRIKQTRPRPPPSITVCPGRNPYQRQR